MQHNYVKKICPYCKKTISRETYLGAKRELYGSPFFECPSCRKTYIDSEYQELAREDYEANVVTIPRAILSCWPGLGLFVILFSVAIYLFVEEGISKDSLAPLVISLLLLILFVILPTRAAYKRKDEVQKSYDAEWEASTKRMSDPAYVFTLYKAGYYIPPKYRETIKPLLMPKEALAEPTEQEYLWAKKVIDEMKTNALRVKDIADLFHISVKDVATYYVSVINVYNTQSEHKKNCPAEISSTPEDGTNRVASESSSEKKNEPAKSDTILFCRKCGAKLLKDSVFCSRCGEKVVREY